MVPPHGAHHVTDVRDVVRDRELPVLPRHPAPHDVPPVGAVVAMQCLYRDAHPCPALRNPPQLGKVTLGVLAVAVETDQERRRAGLVGRLDEIAAVDSGRDRVDDGRRGRDGTGRGSGHAPYSSATQLQPGVLKQVEQPDRHAVEDRAEGNVPGGRHASC